MFTNLFELRDCIRRLLVNPNKNDFDKLRQLHPEEIGCEIEGFAIFMQRGGTRNIKKSRAILTKALNALGNISNDMRYINSVMEAAIRKGLPEITRGFLDAQENSRTSKVRKKLKMATREEKNF